MTADTVETEILRVCGPEPVGDVEFDDWCHVVAKISPIYARLARKVRGHQRPEARIDPEVVINHARVMACAGRSATECVWGLVAGAPCSSRPPTGGFFCATHETALGSSASPEVAAAWARLRADTARAGEAAIADRWVVVEAIVAKGKAITAAEIMSIMRGDTPLGGA